MPTEFSSPYFQNVGLSSSGRPVMNDNEHDVIMQNGIGLYQDEYKLSKYQNGRVYLTNQRLVFINDDYRTKNVSLCLEDIENIESYNGFLKSSPKVILKMRNRIPTKKNTNIEEIKFSFPWICPICSYSNHMTVTTKQLDDMKKNDKNLPVCNTCGVKSNYDVIDKYFIKSIGSTDRTKESLDLLSFDGAQCPTCTFINHPSMTKCEMCGSPLVWSSSSSLNAPYNSQGNIDDSSLKFTTLDSFNDIDLQVIKLSFRLGGHKTFYAMLKEVFANIQYDKNNNDTNVSVENDTNSTNNSSGISNGIHGLTSNSKQRNYEDSLLLNKSVQDLNQLMSKAKDLIILSKKYQNILVKTNNDQAVDQNFELLQNSKSSINKLNRIIDNNKIAKSIYKTKTLNALTLLKNGKPSIDTKSKLPDLYLDELCRHICEFLVNEDILDGKNGLITLNELYSSYNNWRQINLLTPQELYDAVWRFDSLNINLKVSSVFVGEGKILENGSEVDKLLFIHTISKKNEKMHISSKILKYINEHDGASILKLQQDHFNINFNILRSILYSLTLDGKITVDKSHEGDIFWPNKILEFSIHSGKDEIKTSAYESPEITTLQNQFNEIEISKIFKTLDYNVSSTSDKYKDLQGLTFL